MSLKNIIKVALLDMDGVLRIGTRAICGATNVFSYLKSLHIQPMIITNECRYTDKQIKKDLKKMNFLNIEKIPIITSGNVCKTWLTTYLKDYNTNSININIISEYGLKDTIYSLLNIPKINNIDFSIKYDNNKQNILILGNLFNYTNYHEQILEDWMFNDDLLIVKTCNDDSIPEGLYGFNDKCVVPNTILDLFRKEADICTGKPELIYNMEIQQELKKLNLQHIKPSEILLIGDTIETDIRMGYNSGYKTVLVLSGNTKNIADISNNIIQPDYILLSVEDLPRIM